MCAVLLLGIYPREVKTMSLQQRKHPETCHLQQVPNLEAKPGGSSPQVNKDIIRAPQQSTERSYPHTQQHCSASNARCWEEEVTHRSKRYTISGPQRRHAGFPALLTPFSNTGWGSYNSVQLWRSFFLLRQPQLPQVGDSVPQGHPDLRCQSQAWGVTCASDFQSVPPPPPRGPFMRTGRRKEFTLWIQVYHRGYERIKINRGRKRYLRWGPEERPSRGLRLGPAAHGHAWVHQPGSSPNPVRRGLRGFKRRRNRRHNCLVWPWCGSPLSNPFSPERGREVGGWDYKS